MDEVYGETEDLIARAIQEMSNKKKVTFRDVVRRSPAIDPYRVFGIMQQMEQFGAVKQKRPFWGVSRRADFGSSYRVNQQLLARYRENYAAPPPYEQTNKPLPPVPTDKPLPARPTISPREAIQNIIQKDSEQMIKYQVNQITRPLDSPIRELPAFSGEARKSISLAASRRPPGVEAAPRAHQNPGTANGNYPYSPNSQSPKRHAR